MRRDWKLLESLVRSQDANPQPFLSMELMRVTYPRRQARVKTITFGIRFCNRLVREVTFQDPVIRVIEGGEQVCAALTLPNRATTFVIPACEEQTRDFQMDASQELWEDLLNRANASPRQIVDWLLKCDSNIQPRGRRLTGWRDTSALSALPEIPGPRQ